MTKKTYTWYRQDSNHIRTEIYCEEFASHNNIVPLYARNPAKNCKKNPEKIIICYILIMTTVLCFFTDYRNK